MAVNLMFLPWLILYSKCVSANGSSHKLFLSHKGENGSVSCQFSDIGSYNQLSNEQKSKNGPNPSKHVCLCKMFHKENYLVYK